MVPGDKPDLIEHARVLEEANRAKDEFLAVLAHELRQPLGAALTALELMKTRRNRRSGERAREVLERQILHIARLVDDLTDVSRIAGGEISLHQQPLILQDIVDQTIETVRLCAAEKRQTHSVDAPQEAIRISGDPQRLQQVLVNIVTNACKYTPVEGHIGISVQTDGAHGIVRVTDTGPGISAEDLPRIFDLFTRGSRTSESGLGVGLAIARRLVERHGGTIQAHSQGAGRGSEFVITLPLSAEGV